MTQIVKDDDIQEEFSLNAELEEDGEREPSAEELFAEVVPGEVPDLREDVHLIAVLESRLQDLEYLRQDMLRSRGMCQQFALEGQRLLPGFGSNAPTGYYTQQPSATRYRLSLEEISKGIWALIAAAIAAVVALIVKIFMWWRSDKEDPRKSAADKAAGVKKNEAALKTTQDKVADLTQTLQAGEVQTLDQQGEPDKRVTMSSLMEDVWDNQARYLKVTEFLSKIKPVYYDIITQGAYTKAFRALVPAFNNLAQLLRTKVKTIAQVSEMDRHSFLAADEATSRRVLDVVSKPVPLHFNGREKIMEEVAQDLAALRAELPAHNGPALKLDQLVDSVIEAYRAAPVAKFFESQAQILDVLQDLHVELDKLNKLSTSVSSDVGAGNNSPQVAKLLSGTIAAVKHDISGYHHLFAELSHYGVELEQLASETVGIAQEVENQLFAMARKGQIKVPEAWKTRAKRERAATLERLFRTASPSGK